MPRFRGKFVEFNKKSYALFSLPTAVINLREIREQPNELKCRDKRIRIDIKF